MEPLRFSILPTPFHRLDRLSEMLRVDLWCKRDDMTGFALGGNKTRKLDYLVAEALARGATDLIAVGGTQSNFCRLAAAYASRTGLRVHLILGGTLEHERGGGNLFLAELFGASINRVHSDDWREWESEARALEERLVSEGCIPYRMPIGGSTPTGIRGYTDAFTEILEDARHAGIEIGTIICATSSGGTHAGLLVGKARTRWNGRIIGMAVAKSSGQLREETTSLARATATLFHTVIDENDVHVDDRYLGPVYAIPTMEGREAQSFFARLEGIVVDDVYTAKAAAGLIALCRERNFPEGKAVVFLHTGGIPYVFSFEKPSLSQ
ncbi:MAG: D-cysteine desulfhydrase family protein [Bacteroidota bacterium]|nr:D-cysteine desulfhydrase family protein [Bacteroidota bacterium]